MPQRAGHETRGREEAHGKSIKAERYARATAGCFADKRHWRRGKLCRAARGRILPDESPNEAGGGTMKNAKSVCVSAIVLAACLVWMPSARAQSDQEQSVAEAARKAREQKKTAAKPTTVITNDTLKPATPATVQQATATTERVPATDATDGASAAQPAKGPSEREIAEKKAKIEA